MISPTTKIISQIALFFLINQRCPSLSGATVAHHSFSSSEFECKTCVSGCMSFIQFAI